MFFTRHKGVRHDAEPASEEFILKAVVNSMSDIEGPIDGRRACVIELFSEEPIMVNGETEHLFKVYVPNYNMEPRFNYNRMKFWLCYGHREPVMLNECEEPVVPLIDADDYDYFTGRTFNFNCRVVRFTSGREIIKIGYYPKDR